MARYDKAHKEATRSRIVERAGRRFKRDGIDGSGIATLMADAGLTNGAFYAHFTSKEDLVATVVADQLRSQRERFGAEARDRAGFERFLREYLSSEHRDRPEEGCCSAALLDEIVRSGEATKRAYTDEMLAFIDQITTLAESGSPRARRAWALSVFASMIGTLQLSRALADKDLADDVLAQGIENALVLLDQRPRRVR